MTTASETRVRGTSPYLTLLLALMLVRVGVAATDFGRHSLQMDLASFWTAGRAVALDLDPYANHPTHEPPVWDGVALHRHSRFLYPPPAAWLFRPLAALPYAAVKWGFMLVAVAALAWALRLAERLVDSGPRVAGGLVPWILAAAYFPLLALLERGQIDSVVLLLVVAAIGSMRTRRGELAGGLILAAATLLKLHCVFLIPLVAWTRRWRALAGFTAGSIAIVAAALVLDGPSRLSDYLARDLPRIARYGDGGSSETRLPPEAFRAALAGVPPGMTAIDGRIYEPERLRFVLNASLGRTPVGRALWSALSEVGLHVPPGALSLVFLAPGLAIVGWRMRRSDAAADWFAALVLVVLCAPVGWAMGTVWFLPAAPVVLAGWRGGTRRDRVALGACAAGLLLAALPDGPFLDGPLALAGSAKYVVAGLLCLAGLLGVRSPIDSSSRRG